MSAISVLSFTIEPLPNERSEVLTLVPVINGTRLTELITRFEREHGLEPVGGYAGLIPGRFAYDPIDRYFMGKSTDSYWDSLGGYYLLGCQCGEVGCWPLIGRITKFGDSVIWDAFRQPHRANRDYSGFGPFTFAIEQYGTVVSEMAAQFAGRE